MFVFEKICCVYHKVILYRKCCDSFHVTFYLFAVPAFISVYGLVDNSRALGFTE